MLMTVQAEGEVKTEVVAPNKLKIHAITAPSGLSLCIKHLYSCKCTSLLNCLSARRLTSGCISCSEVTRREREGAVSCRARES
jgi:hypothetical protein